MNTKCEITKMYGDSVIEIERLFLKDEEPCFEKLSNIEFYIKKCCDIFELSEEDLQDIVDTYEKGGKIGIKLQNKIKSNEEDHAICDTGINSTYGCDSIGVESEVVQSQLLTARDRISQYV